MATKPSQSFASAGDRVKGLTAAVREKDKLIPLPEAISKNIKPGMTVYIGEFANRATREIIRQFWGREPSFTVAGGSRNYTDALVFCGLARKLIGASFGQLYPTPGPSPSVQRSFKEGKIGIETWGSFIFLQRLMAGAMGLDCMVTKSMIGSSLAEENKDSYKEIEPPFERGQRLALVKALNPDVAVVHGLASDRQGNVIMGCPNRSQQDVWGAMASRLGAFVTVEHIVTTEFIREHSCLVAIPSQKVKTVSEVPFGAHPEAMFTWGMGIKQFRSYDVDYGFIREYRSVARDPARLESWLKEWVLGCSSEEKFLHKLGEERIAYLTRKARPQNGENDLDPAWQTLSLDSKPSNAERMVLAAAGKIREIILGRNYQSILTGIGYGSLASWLAYDKLRKEGYRLKLIVGNGLVGYSPQPGSPQVSSPYNTRTAEMITGTFETYGVLVGGLNNRCLSILGAGQIDKHGNINSTRMAPGQFLRGPGGANDAVNAEEVLVVAVQSKERFVDRVNYVTCPGENVKTAISDKGVFEKLHGDQEFILTSYYADPGISKEDGLRLVKENCGWPLKISSRVREIPPPGDEEVMMLRAFDPEGLFRKDFRGGQ